MLSIILLKKKLEIKNLSLSTVLFLNIAKPITFVTRPETRLPATHAGGQGPDLRQLGRRSKAKDYKNINLRFKLYS